MQITVDFFSLSLYRWTETNDLKKNRGSRFIGLAWDDKIGGARRRETTGLDGNVGAAADWRHSRSRFVASGACSVNLLSACVSVKATQQRRTATNRPCQEVLLFSALVEQTFVSLFGLHPNASEKLGGNTLLCLTSVSHHAVILRRCFDCHPTL